jgi:LysR family glycine cleavage system transcriptional activator
MVDWRDVPSLSALRAFEAAARLGSLSAAARELNVTHAAIAGHVRTLERHFGVALMHRQGQGMASTPEGALLAQGLRDGFGTLAAACRDLQDRRRARPLQITTTPAFAEHWLMPRIGRFWAEHPDISIAITPSPEVVDLRRDGYDLAIRYGAGGWPGVQAEPFTHGGFTVVAAPTVAARLAARLEASPDDPAALRETLLAEIWLMDPYRAEQRYVARALDADPEAMTVWTFATNGMVLSAIRAGMGVGLQSRVLVQDDIDGGRLVPVTDLAVEGIGYHLVTAPGGGSEALRTFCRWLRRSA